MKTSKLDANMLLNTERAEEVMAKYDLRAIIAASPTNVAYFTDFDCWAYRTVRENMLVPGGSESLRQGYAAIGPDRGSALIVNVLNSLFGVEMYEGELRPYGSARNQVDTKDGDPFASAFNEAISKCEETPADALIGLLKDWGITKGRVAIETRSLSLHTRRSLRRLPDVRFVDCTELIRYIRMVKTKDEVDRIRTAAQINEKGLVKSLDIAKDGVKAGELYRSFLSEIARNGATFDHYIYSLHGFGTTNNEDYRFRNGDFTLVDTGCIFMSYYSDTAVTLMLGQNREGTRHHEALWDMTESVVDVLRPGTTTAKIMSFLSDACEKTRLKNVDYEGHGIGLEPRENPIISSGPYRDIFDHVLIHSVEIPLEPGMVINIEVGVNLSGQGACQVERTFLIGKKGAKELTPLRNGLPYVRA